MIYSSFTYWCSPVNCKGIKNVIKSKSFSIKFSKESYEFSVWLDRLKCSSVNLSVKFKCWSKRRTTSTQFEFVLNSHFSFEVPQFLASYVVLTRHFHVVPPVRTSKKLFDVWNIVRNQIYSKGFLNVFVFLLYSCYRRTYNNLSFLIFHSFLCLPPWIFYLKIKWKIKLLTFIFLLRFLIKKSVLRQLGNLFLLIYPKLICICKRCYLFSEIQLAGSFMSLFCFTCT